MKQQTNPIADPFVFAARLLGCEVLYDEQGKPNVMIPVPRFKLSEMLENGPKENHPAFLVDHDQKDVIYISLYPLSFDGDGTVSMPNGSAIKGLSFEQANAACCKKGEGWHLMTNAEWAAVSLWRKKAQAYMADACSQAALLEQTQWVGGLRIVDEQIQILPNNNAAITGIDQSDASDQWRALLKDGTKVMPGTTGALTLADCAQMGDDAPFFLRALALTPSGASTCQRASAIRPSVSDDKDGTALWAPQNEPLADVCARAAYVTL